MRKTNPDETDWERKHREWLYGSIIFDDASIEEEIKFIKEKIQEAYKQGYEDGVNRLP